MQVRKPFWDIMKTGILPYFFEAAGILLYLSFLSYSPFSFNFETENNQQYSYIVLLPICTLGLLFYFLKTQTFSFFSLLSILAIVLLFLLLVFSEFYTFSNEHFFYVVAIAILFATGQLVGQGIKSLNRFILFSFLIFLYQLWLGLEQYNNFCETCNAALAITGSLQNSGIYACWLIVQLPFLWYLFFQLKINDLMETAGKGNTLLSLYPQWFYKYKSIGHFLKSGFFVLLLSLVFFLVYQTQSRSAMAALFMIIVFYLTGYGKWQLTAGRIKLPKYFIAGAALFVLPLLSIGAWFLFNMKRASAVGRLLKVEVTGEHITDNFWFGTGLGRFSWYYPQWQAEYFKTHQSPSPEYYFSAGESYIIFNEWLQLFKEVGLVGFLVFIALLIYFFTTQSKKHGHLLLSVKAVVMAILVCGFTSYPLHVNALLFLLFFSFMVAAMVDENQTFLKKSFTLSQWLPLRAFLFILIVLMAYTSYLGTQQLIAVYKWNNLRNNHSLSRAESKSDFSDLYLLLKHDGKFLTEYGDFLMRDSTDCQSAIVVLENVEKYFISRKTIEFAGYSYLRMKNFPKAIEHFTWLSNYLPNLFRPKFELLKIYKEMGDKAGARRTGNLILTMPVKIPSGEVENIKQETRIILKGLE